MSFKPMMSIFKCKNCSRDYEADVSTLASKNHKCPYCGETNGEEQNTYKDKDGWETF